MFKSFSICLLSARDFSVSIGVGMFKLRPALFAHESNSRIVVTPVLYENTAPANPNVPKHKTVPQPRALKANSIWGRCVFTVIRVCSFLVTRHTPSSMPALNAPTDPVRKADFDIPMSSALLMLLLLLLLLDITFIVNVRTVYCSTVDHQQQQQQ